MKMKRTLLVLLLLAWNASALIESSTQELTPGINNFTVIVDCGECEVEILKEVESKYKSTKTSSQTSEKVTESQSSSSEVSATDSDSVTDSIKSADEEGRNSCGCVYRDEDGAESPGTKRICCGFEEVIPKVLESTSVENISSSESAKSLTSGNETAFKKTKENPVEETEVEDYSFYEDIPFVVLGPSKKKGTGRFEFMVYVSGIEGAYWIPVKVDGKTEYVGVLFKRPAVNKTVPVEEEPEGKPSYLPFIILLCIGALLLAVWYFKFRGNSPEFVKKLKEKLKHRGGDER
ncbi:MAG: hypothetical protein A7316_03485 [Candidatus Altiarchaeales archaeon WOR_SM1_86-2]|nr:MAG: hypothetical protein A7316_03485 [Candidatus Altiarchaeales archaeon WOR_SM1_86-2]